MQTEGARAVPFTRFDMGVTDFWNEADESEQVQQRQWQQELCGRGDIELADTAFVSRLAVVYPQRLRLGERTYVSAHSYFWGDVEVGADATLNPFTQVRGQVRIGDGVRVGPNTSILGFNHGMATDRPIYQQPLTTRGITIGDDVWIGSHVVVLDGVTVGAHSVVAAGAVVTKDVAPWSIVAGNPARRLRDRRQTTADHSVDSLKRIAEAAMTEIPAIVEQAWDERAGSFKNHAGAAPTVRAWCDAIELADLTGDLSVLPIDPARCIEELRSRQEPVSGLVPEWGEESATWDQDGHASTAYHVLCVGYALDLLGSRLPHPIATVADMSSLELRQALASLPWRSRGWASGSWVDSLGTAMTWNARLFDHDTDLETLLGWLLARCDPRTGLWGEPTAATGWLEPINGTYRLTRGTFAALGLPLPYPERTIDSVLAHADDQRHFGPARGTACDTLDVIHPLWLAARQSKHRHDEGQAWARRQIDRIAAAWQPQQGFSFALQRGDDWQRRPSLLGTEMWLAITWHLADHLGMSDALDFRPRGIHRPEPAMTIGSDTR